MSLFSHLFKISRKMLPVPSKVPLSTFCSKAHSAEYHIYPLHRKNLYSKYFDAVKCEVYDYDEDWVDYEDVNKVLFRASHYMNPQDGFVKVCSDGSRREEIECDIEELELDLAGNGTAAAVKRSDAGYLLSSCAVKLGFVPDVLTTKAEGAYLGLLISSEDEKVELCLDSMELVDLLIKPEKVAPKPVEDLVSEVRSLIETKRRNGATVNVRKISRIANYFSDRMSQLPYAREWVHPPRTPEFYNSIEELPTQELKEILIDDFNGLARVAKKRSQVKRERYFVASPFKSENFKFAD